MGQVDVSAISWSAINYNIFPGGIFIWYSEAIIELKNCLQIKVNWARKFCPVWNYINLTILTPNANNSDNTYLQVISRYPWNSNKPSASSITTVAAFIANTVKSQHPTEIPFTEIR